MVCVSDDFRDIPPGMIIVRSPVACLDMATRKAWDFIVICFGDRPIKIRNALTELCLALKNNPYANTGSVAAVLHQGHRELIRTLCAGGIDFIKVTDSCGCDNGKRVLRLVDELTDEDGSETVLSRYCPYLRYHPISRRGEMISCGAYLNRLVLGTPRLRRFCEISNYKNCEYFQNPKTVQAKNDLLF